MLIGFIFNSNNKMVNYWIFCGNYKTMNERIYR